jgi:uncharacterized membrane protein HdeD (DUF308 family)
MAFFKKYNGTTNLRLVRMERLIWTMIYGGLLAVVLAYFVETTQNSDATAIYAIGILATAMGVVMVYARSRLREEK